MKPTRTTQPYRKRAPRLPGPALSAMLKGRTAAGYNPADVQRSATQLRAAGRRKRATRAPRPPRPPRPPR